MVRTEPGTSVGAEGPHRASRAAQGQTCTCAITSQQDAFQSFLLQKAGWGNWGTLKHFWKRMSSEEDFKIPNHLDTFK